MRFPAYPKYKPSGAEWLGDLPEHWDVARLRYLLIRNDGGVWGDEDDPDGTIVLRSTEQTLDGGWKIDDPARRKLSEAEKRDGLLMADDLVVTKSSGSALHIGKTSLVTSDIAVLLPCFSNFMQRLRVSSSFNPRLVFYVLNSPTGRQQLVYNSNTTTGLANLNGSVLGDVVVSIPCSLREQRAITDFLDRETARIDTLAARKQALIERLKEKRTALISRTVTQGLPPDAARAAGFDPHPKLRPSGIDWLGNVPEHWKVTPLKRAVRFVEGPGIMAVDFADEGVPLLRISSIGGPKATLEGCNYLLEERVTEKWAHFRVRCGDLLISGSASTGFCSEVDKVTEGAIPYTGIIIIRPFERVTEKAFVRWFFLSEVFLAQAGLARTGSTIQHFGPSHLSRMIVAVPPLPEQCHIASFLDHETAKIDGMIVKVQTAIERLQEYRTALITAAVTGKIDVRGAVA